MTVDSSHARIVFAALVIGCAVHAQSAWVQAATAGPMPRESHGMAFDPLRGRTVVFGGNNAGLLADTWEWDGSTWVPQLLANSPGARSAAAMVFDVARGRVILFGGTDGVVGPLGDTWAWDGATWTQVHVGGPARLAHAMVYDSLRSRIVVFGGNSGSARGDTWEWDGQSWSQRATTGPSPRTWAGMAFDSVRGRTVLFGGSGGSGPAGVLGDTWEWDGVTWTQRSSGGPLPRHSPAMTFFRQRGRCLLYGGWHTTTPVADTWEWDGNNWSQLAVNGPGPRVFHSMVFDSQRRKAVLWGGADGQASPTDTWELGFPMASEYGTGCTNSTFSLSAVGAAPPVISSTAQASIANRPSTVVFIALGLSRTWYGVFALPVTLAGIGMPGCNLLQSADVVGEPATITGTTTAYYNFAIPNNAALVGMHLYLQGWAWAPGANPANIIVSNGLDWHIGY